VSSHQNCAGASLACMTKHLDGRAEIRAVFAAADTSELRLKAISFHGNTIIAVPMVKEMSWHLLISRVRTSHRWFSTSWRADCIGDSIYTL
jgi:hypothetical protein